MMTRSDVSTYSSSSLIDPEADVVHAGAAVLLRHRTSEQPELRHLRQDLRVEPMLPIELSNARRHLAGAPLAHRALDQLMFFGKIEIHVIDVPEMRSEVNCIARLPRLVFSAFSH